MTNAIVFRLRIVEVLELAKFTIKTYVQPDIIVALIHFCDILIVLLAELLVYCISSVLKAFNELLTGPFGFFLL